MGDAAAAAPHKHPVDPVRVAHARARALSTDDAERLTSLLSLLADPMRADTPAGQASVQEADS